MGLAATPGSPRAWWCKSLSCKELWPGQGVGAGPPPPMRLAAGASVLASPMAPSTEGRPRAWK